ncbi:hypothetical protein D1871_15240 [Nakamurella silvestris]|nr:hypothetical protein D1871_15240 [Nakamurella silvestris]
MHDDGDAFPYGCGEGYSDWNDPYSSRIAAEGIGMLRPDNGHGWTGHLQSYCSDTNYVMPGAAIPNVNWRKGSLPIGAYVDISVKFVESDGGGPTQWVEAVGAKLVTVPKVGAPQDFVISAEGSNGGYGHVRMDYHLRLSTS